MCVSWDIELPISASCLCIFVVGYELSSLLPLKHIYQGQQLHNIREVQWSACEPSPHIYWTTTLENIQKEDETL
jgi:hypothetical protein